MKNTICVLSISMILGALVAMAMRMSNQSKAG